MAQTGISEFTFGYAFLYEQTHANWKDLKAAPILPSLKDEAGKGWDAHLPLFGTDFYYQFKLSDYLSSSLAKYIREKVYKSAYYRIALHKRNNSAQHNLLISHAMSHPNTFYVSPEFSGVTEFNKAFLGRQIMHRSRLIPVSKCMPIIDSKQHYLTYQPGSLVWAQHSEPKVSEDSRRGDQLESIYRESERIWRPIDDSFAKNLFDKVTARVAESNQLLGTARMNENLLSIDEGAQSKKELIKRSAELLAVNFGVTMVLVGRGENVEDSA